MDKNTFTGLFLILIILVGSTFLLKPSEEEIKKEKALQDSLAKAKSIVATPQGQQKPQNNQVILGDSTLSSAIQTEAISFLENDKIKLSLSNVGGKIVGSEIKTETDYQGKPVVLFKNANFGLEFISNGKQVNTNNLFFSRVDSLPNKVTYRYAETDGSYIDYTYTLENGSNQVEFNIALKGYSQKIPGSTTDLNMIWGTSLLQQEKDIKNERHYSTIYYRTLDGDVDHLSETESDEKSLEDKKINWISFKQHFFSTAIISNDGFGKVNTKVETSAANDIVKKYNTKLSLAYKPLDVNTYNFSFYFGNNKFSQLKDQGHDLEKQVKMGWGPLKWINRYLVLPIFNFFNNFNLSYGLIILLLTLILKTVLFPFTYKSYLSMAKMRVLKPEMDEIKAKVGEDNQALLQQEYLKLYKQAGVNPLGGCLPLLFQMPFILAFFYFFPNLFELRHESFLWMKDLSTYDDLIKFPAIPLLGWDHISLMCLLMTASTLIYTYFNNQTSNVQGQMKYIGYITPLIFFGVLNSYPSGLNYYYFCANILTFTQQILIRRFVNDDKIHAQIQEYKKKPETSKKKSGFQKKLEDMMRQQQQMQQQQKNKK
ncbi:membrane protein insertase YidC [Pseudopedobacter beijingensis]|uniref:Membrane protein insertase YidC n=1 Tax=Pseudopedobacter beijingensis TaxID=1207056 RepID=A0ABW4IEG8_9SPHI